MELIQVNLNFNSGRQPEIIEKIVNVIKSEPVYVLDVDQGWDADRTVITVAGTPKYIIEAVYKSAQISTMLIDMNKYTGTHPHIGSLDVVPVMPLKNSSIKKCIEYSKLIARKISKLGVPIFLYGESIQQKKNFNLADIRKGNFKELQKRISENIITPDLGNNIHPTAGATCIGAEKLYLAYNINLNTKDLIEAKKITSEFYSLRKTDDKLKSVQAIAWYQEKFNCCQISTNLLDYESFGLHEAYTFFSNLADKFNLMTSGSEIIGLVPLAALQAAGRHYNDGNLEPELKAIKYLGLNSVKSFELKDKVIECKLEAYNELHNLSSN